MDENQERFCSNIATISGLLLPISLTSISLIGIKEVTGIAKNYLMFGIGLQIISLILSLVIALNLCRKNKTKDIDAYLNVSWIALIIALAFIAVNHLVVLFS